MYPYLCDKFHLGIFYLSSQVVNFMALSHDLNDELILTDGIMVSQVKDITGCKYNMIR